MADVVVISKHKKGFYQGDLYRDASDWKVWQWECGNSPDSFFTRKKDGTLKDAQDYARKIWPRAKIEYAEQQDDE